MFRSFDYDNEKKIPITQYVESLLILLSVIRSTDSLQETCSSETKKWLRVYKTLMLMRSTVTHAA